MSKKQRREKPAAQPARKTAAVSEQTGRETDRFSIGQYVLMNIIFDAFCLVQLLIVYLVLRETKGLVFFFGLLMVGFLVVSIFDYVYDRVFARSEAAAGE